MRRCLDGCEDRTETNRPLFASVSGEGGNNELAAHSVDNVYGRKLEGMRLSNGRCATRSLERAATITVLGSKKAVGRMRTILERSSISASQVCAGDVRRRVELSTPARRQLSDCFVWSWSCRDRGRVVRRYTTRVTSFTCSS